MNSTNDPGWLSSLNLKGALSPRAPLNLFEILAGLRHGELDAGLLSLRHFLFLVGESVLSVFFLHF
jgi:hypothetical protein